ncbi:aminotransferase-like domain-containing protein [Ruegeria jejuensis]|uniref:aminotransferase-like domain-containing protein n=1 Tax=Ruegeria jejuensis TaxID=3233338 RepID=UPI00355C92C4
MVEHLLASRMSRMKASEIRELLKLLDQPGIISFAGGIPDPDLFPADAFAEATARALNTENRAHALQYSISEGHLPLRRWIVQHMAELGVRCSPEQVLITSGSQQALDYLGKLFLSQNDTALVEWPTYMGALAAFNAYEPNFEQLNLQGNRAAGDYAKAAAEAGGRVKFAYLSSDFANPTGETLDLAGRERLLDLAEELDCPIIDDAAYRALRYDGEPVPPLLALEQARKGDLDACRVIHCGSFSKTLSPGVRMGWVVAAQPIISKMVLLKQASDLHTPTLNQVVICDVAERHFERHVAMLREVYARRRDRMLAALERHMPAGTTWTRPEGGMFIWVTLPVHLNGDALLAKAVDSAKVAFVPGQAFFADGSGDNTIRLSFSCAKEDEAEEGIRRLGQLLRAHI